MAEGGSSPGGTISEGTEMLTREQMAMRVAQELRDGDYVNLGIGIPTMRFSNCPTISRST
jgi:acyl CoA:acetate/3-ketoacid CoA transferase beta subunit